MKPPVFDYLAPSTVPQALEALAQRDGARLLAGGQSLVPAMNLRLARPDSLIDINRIKGLNQIKIADGRLSMGALVRHHGVASSAEVARAAPVIARTAGGIAHEAIRRRGTVCGSLAHADPAAQWPLLARLFDARFELQSLRGQRWVAADDFFRGIYQTAAEPDEMLTQVSFGLPLAEERSTVRWFSRRHGDFMIGAVGMRLRMRADGCIDRLTIVGGGFEPTPSDLSGIFQSLEGRRPDRDAFVALTEQAPRFEPLADLRASAQYRRELLRRLLRLSFDDCVGAA